MAIKIEFEPEIKTPRKAKTWIESLFKSLPREHTRGIERIRLVDTITDPRFKNVGQRPDLPGLYHPKQGAKAAWLEVAIGVLIPNSKPFAKRILPRLSFRGNLAAIIYSLVGQHYYLTLRHSIKRTQIEAAVRSYTEKNLRVWHEQQHTIRARLFKPFQPTFERWGRALQKRATEERKKKQFTP
jgi:hypothetical protein